MSISPCQVKYLFINASVLEYPDFCHATLLTLNMIIFDKTNIAKLGKDTVILLSMGNHLSVYISIFE